MVIVFYLLFLIFTYWFAYYSKWQFIDEDDGPGWRESDTKWHRAGFLMRMCFGLAMAGWCFSFAIPKHHFFIVLPIVAAEFDIAMNLLRGKKWDHVGSGGWDARIGKKKYLLYLIWFILTIVITTLWKLFA